MLKGVLHSCIHMAVKDSRLIFLRKTKLLFDSKMFISKTGVVDLIFYNLIVTGILFLHKLTKNIARGRFYALLYQIYNHFCKVFIIA